MAQPRLMDNLLRNTMLKKMLLSHFQQALRSVALSLLLVSQLAMAQPVVGQTYKEFLPMGGGASVPLPDGIWKATHSSKLPVGSYEWEIHTLKNLQPDAKVPFLVVRQSLTGVRWGNTNCQSNAASQFMVNEHGTVSSQILNKCSRYFAYSDFSAWKKVDEWTSPQPVKDWWKAAVAGMTDDALPPKTSIFMAEMTVQQFNGRGLRIEAFVLPPKGVSAGAFRDEFRAGKLRPEHDMLSAWTSIYIESMQQSYFNKKPQALMALAYPVRTTAGGPGSAAAAAVALAEPGRATQAPLKPSAPQATDKPAPSAPAADMSEKLRLEQERKAMDEEKRKMAQQLEVMTQMLAKLQQDNAAALAAAATAKSKEAAAEPTKPQQPVAYANRKALVIGNDKYTDVAPLNNAAADADAMAKSLEQVGYKVFKHHNLTEKKFKQAVRDFRQQLSGGDEVLFFYAGHGVQLGAANYLLPIDVKGEAEDQVKDDAILLQKVLDDLEEKKTKFALAVIDACRDNPFKGKGRALGGRGLAPTTAATGQMIMFSAGSGQQALDRLGDDDKEKNGLFTRIFVKEMLKPGLSVDRVLRNVRNEVVRLAKSVGHEQTPALYDQAIGEFYFRQ
jgi:Caspase domain